MQRMQKRNKKGVQTVVCLTSFSCPQLNVVQISELRLLSTSLFVRPVRKQQTPTVNQNRFHSINFFSNTILISYGLLSSRISKFRAFSDDLLAMFTA